MIPQKHKKSQLCKNPHNFIIKSINLRKLTINIKNNFFKEIDTSLYKILAKNFKIKMFSVI